MLSHIEYKILKEINLLVIGRGKNQKSENPLLKDYNSKNLEVRLKDRFRDLSESKYTITIKSLLSKNYIEDESVYSKEFEFERIALTHHGKVALEDYKKDLLFFVIRNAIIPIIGSAFFSALFTWIFQMA